MKMGMIINPKKINVKKISNGLMNLENILLINLVLTSLKSHLNLFKQKLRNHILIFRKSWNNIANKKSQCLIIENNRTLLSERLKI